MILKLAVITCVILVCFVAGCSVKKFILGFDEGTVSPSIVPAAAIIE